MYDAPPDGTNSLRKGTVPAVPLCQSRALSRRDSGPGSGSPRHASEDAEAISETQLLRKIDTHELTGSGKTRGFARAVVLERRNPIFALEKSP